MITSPGHRMVESLVRHQFPVIGSWGKVMFLHVSVILFTGGGGVVSQHALQQVSGVGGGIPACLAGLQAHTRGGGKLRGLALGGLQSHTQGGS